MNIARAKEMKENAERILSEASKLSNNPTVLRWLIQNNIYKDNAEERVAEVLEGVDDDGGPTINQIEMAKTVVTLLLDPKEQEELQQSEQQRWLLK